MSESLIQCVPNFSEGRRRQVIEEIIASFSGKQGCFLLDHRADRDHNRLVVTLVGQPRPIQDALIEAAQRALAKIDLNRHEGAHPRIGAIDVIPFIPLQNIDMQECVELARSFAQRFYHETSIPVYLYEEAATRPERRQLEIIRQGQYEALKVEVIDPARHPDVGEPKLHPTAGATVIGARKFLIAFNVNLGTDNLAVARAIAKAVRSSSGGFCHVKGIGLALEERGLTQVSLNIVDFQKNALYRIVELIRMEAERWGVPVIETEVYGMLPADAILDSAAYYLQMHGFERRQVIELALLDLLGKEDKKS